VETKKEYDRQKKLDKQGATSKRAVETARANWVSYLNQKANAEAQLLQMQASLSEAKANLAKAKADLGAPGDQNAQVRLAKAEVRSAELNLEFTQVKAPVDGYATNLNLRLGSQAVENQASLALVDVNSYWVVGFFKENYIEGIRKGDRAILTLMTYNDKPLEGRVDSLGCGALPRTTAAPGLTCCRRSARLSSGFGWHSVCPCVFTSLRYRRESSCAWARPFLSWS
jgi:multidrug resistance efflux pump